MHKVFTSSTLLRFSKQITNVVCCLECYIPFNYLVYNVGQSIRTKHKVCPPLPRLPHPFPPLSSFSPSPFSLFPLPSSINILYLLLYQKWIACHIALKYYGTQLGESLAEIGRCIRILKGEKESKRSEGGDEVEEKGRENSDIPWYW